MYPMMKPSATRASSSAPLTYRFGPYILDVSRRLLLSGSQAKPVPEKIFQILLILLEAHGRVVEKERFFERLWMDEPVSDANLAQHVFMLRNLLGENARDHAYIVTVPGKGYRFVQLVEAKSGLSMKGSCEGCSIALPPESEAYICSYECTFCPSCSDKLERRCPNCGGEQTGRPRR